MARAEMTQPFPMSTLDVERRPGKPPILRAESTVDAATWTGEHRDALHALVDQHGSLLVRGLGLRDGSETEALFRQIGKLLRETEAFAPRRAYAEGVYSASKWPSNQPMCMHHELSYLSEPPGLMLFACVVAATDGGATTLADSAAVLEALPADLVQRAERHGWLLVRNYNDNVGATIMESFGTDDHKVVETYCRGNAIEFEWQAGGGLRTWQRRSAVVRHPKTGQRCWFNQMAFLNQWTMNPEVREYLMEVLGEDGLPFDTRFGNDEPISAEIVQTINEAYEANSAREPWQAGDLLLVDNIRTAHGREAFEGPRELVVAMAEPVRLVDCSVKIEVTES